jgi:hypothetical protein
VARAIFPEASLSLYGIGLGLYTGWSATVETRAAGFHAVAAGNSGMREYLDFISPVMYARTVRVFRQKITLEDATSWFPRLIA